MRSNGAKAKTPNGCASFALSARATRQRRRHLPAGGGLQQRALFGNSIAVGDFNGDGAPDLALLTGSVEVLLNREGARRISQAPRTHPLLARP